MPTKKAQPQKKQAGSTMDSNAVWKWLYLIGLIVAGLVGAFSFKALDPYLGWLLLLIGILSGIFFLDSDDVVNFGIRFLLLFAVKEALAPAVFGGYDVGRYFTGFFTGVVSFLGPVGLTLLVMWFWKRYFGSML